MKINDSIKNPVNLGAEKPDAGKLGSNSGKKVEKPQTEAKSTGNVTLSLRSAQLQSMEAEVATSSVFDSDKVNAIKSAIAGGQFRVDAEKVANGLIGTVKDLLTAKNT